MRVLDTINQINDSVKETTKKYIAKVPFEKMYDSFATSKVQIMRANLPMTIKISCIKSQTKKKHRWYFTQYRKYLYDAHADVKLEKNNLPDILQNVFTQFTSTTYLNTNLGRIQLSQSNDNELNKILPPIDSHSNFYTGMLTFSKNFLLKNYIINQDQQMADIIFKTLCYENDLNPNDWVFAAALHKNTALFHCHFIMYQKSGSESEIRTSNFSVQNTKQIRLNLTNHFKAIQQTNNDLNKKELKVQQLYIKHAQQTSQYMNLTNDMLDLSLANETTFSELFKQFCSDLITLQPIHTKLHNNFEKHLQQVIAQALETKKLEVNEMLKNETGELNAYKAQSIIDKYENELNTLYDKYSQTWINDWELNVMSKLKQLWNENVGNVCEKYKNEIDSEQEFHILRENEKHLSYLQFAKYGNTLRKRRFKAVLYLTTFWVLQNLVFDDSNLYDEVNKLKSNFTYSQIQELIKKLSAKKHLVWEATNNLKLSI